MKKKLILFIILLSLFLYFLPFTNPSIQNQLNDSSTSKNFSGTGKWSNLTYIRLPKNSIINSATLNLTGYYGDNLLNISYRNYNLTNQTGWTAKHCSKTEIDSPDTLLPSCTNIAYSTVTTDTDFDYSDDTRFFSSGSCVSGTCQSLIWFNITILEYPYYNLKNLTMTGEGYVTNLVIPITSYRINYYLWNFTGSNWVNIGYTQNPNDGLDNDMFFNFSTSELNDFLGNNGTLYYVIMQSNQRDMYIDYLDASINYYQKSLSSNVTLQVNNSYIFNASGTFSTQNQTIDFKGNITGFLTGCTAVNGYCDVPLNISGTNGIVQISAININYTTVPDISIIYPINNSNFSYSNVNVNFTFGNFSAVSCWWTNNSGVTNNTITCGINITGQTWSDGLNTIVLYINNSDNQKNSSSVTFRVDTTLPSLDIVYPVQDASYTTTSLSLNYTVSDSGIGLSTCWYRNHTDANNITLTCGTNTTISQASSGTYTVYMWANDTLNNIANDNVTYQISLDSPAITLKNPTNNKFFNSQNNIRFNFTAEDGNGIDTCELWGNWTNIWHKNQTLTSITSGVETNFNLLNITEGKYKWNVWCNDTTNQPNWASINWTFNIDITYPQINLTYPLNTTYTYLPTTLNYTRSDLNLFSCWYNNGTTNSTPNTNCNNFTITTRQGSQTWIVYVNDSANNVNSSSVTFFIDSINPSINLTTSFSNSSFLNYNTSIIINLTISDTNLQTCWYNDNSGTNTTFTCGTNLSLNLSEALHTINIFANDTLNNVNNTEKISFTPDITFPLIQNISITTTQGSQTITISANITDINLGSCYYSIFNSSGGIDSSTNENTTISPCTSGVSISESDTVSAYATYNLTIYANDSANNLNSSTESFTVSQAVSPTGGAGGGVKPETKLPVIALINPEGLNFNELDRAKLYARIREACQNKTSCILTDIDKTSLLLKLEEQDVDLNLSTLDLFIKNYNNNELEELKMTEADIKKYNLYVSKLEIITAPFMVFPSKIEPIIGWIVVSDTYKTRVTSNKELKSCGVIEGDEGWKCNLVSGSVAELTYTLPEFPPKWSSKLIIAKVSYTDIENNNIFQTINLRAYYYAGASLFNVPLYFYLLLIPVLGVFIFLFRKQVSKRLKIFKAKI